VQNKILASAEFDPKIKVYWMITWVLISGVTIVFIPLIPVVIILVLFIGQRILNAMSAELMERKLVVKRGIWFKVEKSIPLEKITDVGMTQGPLMRIFNLQLLSFETAGQSGDGALVSMLGIIDAAGFREKILNQKDRLQDAQKSAKESIATSPKLSDIAELTSSVKRIESLLKTLIDKQP
jgi:putative membrane protein